jgi:CDGSH-type Zn-finger protein
MNENKKPMVVFDTYGPYIVVGKPKCVNSKGKDIELGPVSALCRCGASKNKPFCDNSHKKIDFKDD